MPGNIKGMRKPRSLKAGVLIRQGTKKALRRNPNGIKLRVFKSRHTMCVGSLTMISFFKNRKKPSLFSESQLF